MNEKIIFRLLKQDSSFQSKSLFRHYRSGLQIGHFEKKPQGENTQNSRQKLNNSKLKLKFLAFLKNVQKYQQNLNW